MAELRGRDILANPHTNKSTAFTREERDRHGLRGLLPHQMEVQDVQVQRVLENLRRKDNDLERYITLMTLQGRNERLFYKVMLENVDEIGPLIYTPTVGQACKEFAHIFREARGFYVTPEDRGCIRSMLDNWPEDDVRVVVVTDGSRILGLGDLGSNGMGIPIGKLALYTACAGIDPAQCLPVMFDIGTNNEELLKDPLYLGVPHERIDGDDYFSLMDEFVEAITDAYPKALVQFEDFLSPKAYALLERFRDRILCFNDDIQGTAAVVLAGLCAATRVIEKPLGEQRFMFLGAGSAATGIGDLLTVALTEQGLSRQEARARLWFVDEKGLVTSARDDLAPHNLPYAHDHAPLGFIEALREFEPHALIGATAHAGAFTREAVETMAANHDRPVLFALSNPTSSAECTAEQAYHWTAGKAIFASGSPFDPVRLGDREFHPGQGNNAYIFPGVGLGAVGCQARGVTDGMFLAAADALAQRVSEDDLALGALYPPRSEIREISLDIAVAVAERAYEQDLATLPRPADLRAHLRESMYDPSY